MSGECYGIDRHIGDAYGGHDGRSTGQEDCKQECVWTPSGVQSHFDGNRMALLHVGRLSAHACWVCRGGFPVVSDEMVDATSLSDV